MRTIAITKQGRRMFQARLIVDGEEAFAFAGKASISHALSLGGFLMAGMSDNPLIGDYTKGISKGPEYFLQLEQRFRREKAPIKYLAEDLASPFSLVMRRQNPLSEAYGKRSFSGAATAQKIGSSEKKSASFLGKSEPETASFLGKSKPKTAQKRGSEKSPRHVKNNFLDGQIAALRDHFGK